MGLAEPGAAPPVGRLLFLSPHLDDGVFACGRLLATAAAASRPTTATVATVFAGRPPADLPLTDWDRAAGFAAGDDVIGQRREEDRQALAILAARPCWLELLDSQYGGAEQEAVAAEVRTLLAACRPHAVFIPLGLFHADHRRVHGAALELLGQAAGVLAWFIYEDALYRRIGGCQDEPLARLAARGLKLSPVRFAEAAGAAQKKAAAVACYGSQLRALTTPGRPGLADLDEPESYWRLERP